MRLTAPSVKTSSTTKRSIGRTDAMRIMNGNLVQRTNRVERKGGPRSIPVARELVAVKRGPLQHERERATWQRAVEHLQVVDPNRGLVVLIPRVEVRRGVIVVVHGDEDSVELAETRHGRKRTTPCAGA